MNYKITILLVTIMFIIDSGVQSACTDKTVDLDTLNNDNSNSNNKPAKFSVESNQQAAAATAENGNLLTEKDYYELLLKLIEQKSAKMQRNDRASEAQGKRFQPQIRLGRRFFD